jgi:hypothetical protein
LFAESLWTLADYGDKRYFEQEIKAVLSDLGDSSL